MRFALLLISCFLVMPTLGQPPTQKDPKQAGVEKSIDNYLEEWRVQASQGSKTAQHALGAIYDAGREVPRDYAEAAKWYRMAAEQGYIAAQYCLGCLYLAGQGVPKDPSEAYVWFNLAAAQGLPIATKTRDDLEATLPPQLLNAAQARARRLHEAIQTKRVKQ